MLDWLSRFWRTSVIGSFLAGLLFLLPVVLTVFIAAYIVNFVRGAIGPGTVLELDRRVGEAIDIYVNNRLVARGEVVLVEDKLGVTMTEIIKAERG